jgi:putative ABC transport system permease protein
MRAGLVVLQVALSLVLLVSAALLVRGFVEVLRIDPGFRAEGRLTFRTMLARETMLMELEERLATIPGVTGVGAISHVPYDDQPNWAVPFSAEMPMPPNAPLADSRAVSPSLFAALEVPVVDGRGFTDDDRHAEHPVVVVDETLARALWPGQRAVGQRLWLQQGERAHTVVGVVRHVRHRSLVDDLLPQVFRPWALAPRNPMAFVVRTAGDPAAMVPAVRAAVSELDPRAAIFEVRPLIEYVDAARATRRFTMILAAAFAGVALLLVCVGVYAVLAYAVAGRRHELGVRRALGASHARVVGAVFGEGLGFALAGSVVGLAGALVAGQLLQAQLYAVDARDPISFAAAVLMVLLGAAIACGIPAYRAASVDPMEALRTE